MKMFLISDNVDTYTGMRLAGVDGVVVHEREELYEALQNVLKDCGDCPSDGEIRERISGSHRRIPSGEENASACGDS